MTNPFLLYASQLFIKEGIGTNFGEHYTFFIYIV